MTTDQLGGTTYTYRQPRPAFLANTPTAIQYFGDLSEPSPFHNGATGPQHIEQEYYVGFAQDEWRVSPKLTLNYGLRYDYYAPLRETRQPDRQVQHRHRQHRSRTRRRCYQSKKNNFQPRISADLRADEQDGPPRRLRHLRRPGPDRRSDSADRGRPHQHDADQRAAARLSRSIRRRSARTSSTTRTTGRTSRAPTPNEYTLPERVYQYTASVQQELAGELAATVAYVGSQGRNLFLRSIANRIIGVQSNGAAAATQIREFDIVTHGTPTARSPRSSGRIAEIDYKTSGGHDSYNAMQLSLTRRSSRGLTLNAQYTLGYSTATPAARTKR